MFICLKLGASAHEVVHPPPSVTGERLASPGPIRSHDEADQSLKL